MRTSNRNEGKYRESEVVRSGNFQVVTDSILSEGTMTQTQSGVSCGKRGNPHQIGNSV